MHSVITTMVFAGALCAVLLPGTRAAAALPELYCEKGFYGPDLVWCIAYQNNVVTVSVGNAAAHEVDAHGAPFKLELVRYRSAPGPSVHGQVLGERSGLIHKFWAHPYGVAKAGFVWTIDHGYYCVRRYTPHDGFWEDIFCLSDTGGYSLGKTGYGEPGK